jgi:pilus assembly protein CpaB
MGRRIIAITAAVLLALVGVVAVVLYANGADQRAYCLGPAADGVHLSLKPSPAGTTLNDAIAGGLIVETTLPAKSVPVGSLTAVTEDNKNLLARQLRLRPVNTSRAPASAPHHKAARRSAYQAARSRCRSR